MGRISPVIARTALVVASLFTMPAAYATPNLGDAEAGWTRFTEPRVQAFTLDTPRGWRVEADIPRNRAAVSARLESADGAISIVLDDPRLMPLLKDPRTSETPASPNPVRYRPASGFIAARGLSLVAEHCDAPRLERLRLRGDVARAIDAVFSSRTAIGGETIVADALFSCTRAGRPSLAYMAIGTHLYPLAGRLQFWQIDMEEIVVAPRAELAGAIAVTDRSLHSVRWSRPWIVAHQAIALGQDRTAAQNLDGLLHQSQRIDDIIHGVGDVFDPETMR